MSTRMHIVVPDELVARIDGALGPGQPRADWVRRAVEQALGEDDGARVAPVAAGPPAPAERLGASEQALGSSGRAGVRGRVPASAPAEQPQGVYVGPEVEAAALAEQPHRFVEAPASVADVDVILGKAAEGVMGFEGMYAPRVRSSSVARPFRPAPKQGKK